MPMALGLGLGLPYMAGPSGPSPALDLNFVAMAASQALDSRITYTGASLATLTNSAGNIAYKPHNLLTYSEQFDNAAWGGFGITRSANAATAPDGAATADALIESALNQTHTLYRSSTVTSTASAPHTYSQYFKANGRDKVVIELRSASNGAYAIFNLTTVSVSSSAVIGAGTLGATSITSVGNGWYRCSLTATCSTDTALDPHVYLDNSGGYLGDGVSGMYSWGAQLNIGSLQPYYPTTSAAYFGPRFTYDPITHAALGLLIEEQRSNLLLNSVLNGGSSGTPGVAPTSFAFAFNGGTTSIGAGPLSGSSITLSVGAAGRHNIVQSFVLSASTTYTLSTNVTALTGTAGDWMILLNVTAGSVSGTSFLAVSAGTGAKSITFTTGAGGASVGVRIGCGVNANTTGAMSITFDSLQLEAGASATSYIPTTSASVTRAADSVTMTGTDFSSWFNAAAGTFVGEATPSNVNAVEEAIAVAMLNSSNFIGVGRNYGGGSPTGIILWVNASGSSQAYIVAGAISAGTKYKAAASYAANAFAECVNGGTVGTDAAGTVPASLNKLNIGQTHNGIYSNSVIARLRYYNTALTNAQLQALTA